MTIVVCGGVLMFGLLSNYLVGRHVFSNHAIGIVTAATPDNPTHAQFAEAGDSYTVALINPPTEPVKPGDSFYYSTSPAGFPMLTPTWPEFKGDPGKLGDLAAAPNPALIISAVEGPTLHVRRAGEGYLSMSRPPERDDYVFIRPTHTNVTALALWGIIPNIQNFWLEDAVSQNQRIPALHLLKLTGYAAAQIAAFLALGVVLFQRRDVG
jgi:hypothetical protein